MYQDHYPIFCGSVSLVCGSHNLGSEEDRKMLETQWGCPPTSRPYPQMRGSAVLWKPPREVKLVWGKLVFNAFETYLPSRQE